MIFLFSFYVLFSELYVLCEWVIASQAGLASEPKQLTPEELERKKKKEEKVMPLYQLCLAV